MFPYISQNAWFCKKKKKESQMSLRHNFYDEVRPEQLTISWNSDMKTGK